MCPASSGGYNIAEAELSPLADFIESHAGEIVQRAERAWESSILLFSQLNEPQREQIRHLAVDSTHIWAMRLRQSSDYARRVHELGQEWGSQASGWQLHVFSFTKALDLLGHATWEYLSENYPMAQLTPSTVFFLGRSRDQVLDDLRVPLLSSYLTQREVEMEQTRFTLQGTLSLPGRSLLQELGNRLQANQDRVVPAWIDSVRQAPGATDAMLELLQRRGGTLVNLLLSLLQSPTPETGAASLGNVRAIGLESAQAGVTFQDMFHALQQLRPVIWDTVYEIYRREQYWHPAEFIEVLARLHLLLDLFSEGTGQAYLQQKEMIIQEQAEELHRRDLNLAREMLESLLPNNKLSLPHTEIGSIWIPAREIGGDFYDIFAVSDEDVMLIIGDVSGKGISAALLVSMVKYVLKANAPLHASPSELLTVANRLLYQDMGPELFVTMFAARYTPATGKLIYTSAGHDPCYLCRTRDPNRTVTLESRGPILGIFPEINLSDSTEIMEPGDILLLYTDGLVNVRCGDRHPVHARRLCRSLHQHADLPAQTLIQVLLQETVSNCEPTDDITLLIAKRTGEVEEVAHA
ncbi:MAG TPA: PP2C family protein-serine/threonine phosphatase [Armatimonadota bacterium]|jgi:sigma-B regulation protein RsbU (phosphoserine phosphatase)